MEPEELLRKIAGILARLNIPYLITGGIAVTVWGQPRFTADIDVVVELVPEKLDRLAAHLEKIDADVYLDKETMHEALRRKGEFNFIHPASGLKVDFWVMRDTPFDRERMRRKIKKQFARTNIFLISPEDLILTKLLWHKESGSEQQLRDVESVLRIQKHLDRRYLKRWAGIHLTSKILTSLWKIRK